MGSLESKAAQLAKKAILDAAAKGKSRDIMFIRSDAKGGAASQQSETTVKNPDEINIDEDEDVSEDEEDNEEEAQEIDNKEAKKDENSVEKLVE